MGKCLQPLIAYQHRDGEKPVFLHCSDMPDRDFEFYVRAFKNGQGRLLLLPCGHCVECVKNKSNEWTARLLKELKSHKYAYFITLTYDDKHLTELNKRDIQLFLKRYRSKFEVDLKYYICGEHGETTNRAHYHAIFFQDKEIPNLKFYANNLYVSKDFAECWKNGNCLISKQVNERSIKYTIAYTLKKFGEEKLVMMSKGIGLDYFKVNKENIKDMDGFYVRNGFKMKPIGYFRRKLKESSDMDDLLYLQIKDSEPKSSQCLSGSTLGDLISKYLSSLDDRTLKGKGVF